MKVSIVIQAKNEAKTIKNFVNSLTNTFKDGEIIVVCNGCTDNTYDIVRSIKKKNVKAMNFGSIGKGGAIIEGLNVAKNPIIGFVDSDGSYDGVAIRKVLSGMSGYDASIASKWKGKKFFSIKKGFFYKLGSRTWNFLIRLFLNLQLTDTQAGLKFFKKSAYDSIDHDFICRGFDFDIELLHKLNKKDYKINEVPVTPKTSKKTTFNVSYTPSMFFNLIKIWMSKQ